MTAAELSDSSGLNFTNDLIFTLSTNDIVTVHTTEVKTRMVLSNNNEMILGDDNPFTILRPNRTTAGNGSDLHIIAQNGNGVNANGGNIVFQVVTMVLAPQATFNCKMEMQKR